MLFFFGKHGSRPGELNLTESKRKCWSGMVFLSVKAFHHSCDFLGNAGLIVVNAWYGKFVNDNSRKNEKVKVIDVTVPLQCLVKDSKLILTEASKVRSCSVKTQIQGLKCVAQNFI